jgi:acetoin utilization deacetylase AcuC-like enzyme
MILPLIQNWRPELILVSCGFDAGMGDPEGEMNVTPFGFGTMAGLLACQNIPLVCLLEGGYFLENIGESSVAVLKALIDRVRSFKSIIYDFFYLERTSNVY